MCMFIGIWGWLIHACYMSDHPMAPCTPDAPTLSRGTAALYPREPAQRGAYPGQPPGPAPDALINHTS